MAALLTSVGDSKDKMALYLNECRRMGIKVLLPTCPTRSTTSRPSTMTSASVSALCATSAAMSSTASCGARKDERFTSFHHFPRQSPSARLEQAHTVESPDQSRCLSTRWGTRGGLSWRYTRTRSRPAVDRKRNEAQGAIGFDFDSLYDGMEEAGSRQGARPPGVDQEGQARPSSGEMLGLYVSDHPPRGPRGPAGQARVDLDPRPQQLRGPSGRRSGDGRRTRDQRAAPRRQGQRKPLRA